MALARLGALPAVADPRLTPPELDAVATSTDARTIVVDPDVATRLEDAGAVGDAVWTLTSPWRGTTDLRTLLGGDDRPTVAAAGRATDDVALLMCTSGTTGTPKAAALTSRGLLGTIGRLAFAPVGQRLGPRARRDRVLAALPLSHVMGFSVALGALCGGVRFLHRGRFDAGEVLDLLERREPNVFVGVPTMYADLEAAGAVALVVAGEGFDPGELLSWAAEEVAGYRRPREVVVADALPRGAHDKVDREEATRLATARTSGAA